MSGDLDFIEPDTLPPVDVTIIHRGWSRTTQCAIAGEKLADAFRDLDEALRQSVKYNNPNPPKTGAEALSWARDQLRQVVEDAKASHLVWWDV